VHIEFLVEEESSEVALQHIVPKILGENVSFRIHPHRGKTDLLSSLLSKMRGYAQWLPDDWRIVVLVDEDRQSCEDLKSQLELAARQANLTTKTRAFPSGDFRILNRIAVEELEAWFFGDVEALHAAYPRVSATLGEKARFRDPDAVAGGTWEAMEQVLQKAGYYKGGLAKIALARVVSQQMDPERNRSASFQAFRNGLITLAQSGGSGLP
jgi:hypothetical protein